MRFGARTGALLAASVSAFVLSCTAAHAIGDDGSQAPPSGGSGGASGGTLTASAATTRIKVTQESGGAGGSRARGAGSPSKNA